MLKTFISIVMAAGVVTVMGIGSPWMSILDHRFV